MKSMLFVTAAAASLALSGLAFAQTEPEAVPASPPPVEAPAQTPDVNVEGQIGTVTQTPADAATTGPAAAPAQVQADAAATTAAPTLVSASSVCQPRVTSVHFGARASALSRDNSNALEHAVDAASVCTLETVTIAASGEGRLASRRVTAARTTLIRQGVPAERITLASDGAAEGADTGQVDIRMNFAGVANAGSSPAATAAAPAAPTPEAPSAEAPQTNEAEPTPDT